MFIFTAKFNKKRAIISVLVLAAVLCAIVLLAGRRDQSDAAAAAVSAVVKTNEDRVEYLNALGWEVDENALEEQEIVIPRKFDSVYEEYNKIQLAQGFDLTKFSGVEVVRYSYKVLNHPSAEGETVVADLIIYRGEVIAGDIQSRAQGGFMEGLDFPK